MSRFRIRAARENDVVAMAKVRVDTWKATYNGIVPDDFLKNLSYQDVAERWRKTFWEDRDPNVAIFVAEGERGEIVGVAICGSQENHDPVYQGDIYLLYVLPEHQNQGNGRELVAACVAYLIHQLHVDGMLIWVLAENPYRRFYESLGGKVVREKTQEIGGRVLSDVGYGWETIHQLLSFKHSGRNLL